MKDFSFRTLFHAFGVIGLYSFGGPAAQIALMHRELVEKRDWLSEDEFLNALSFCMLLPGPEAMQLATYSGWKLRGVPGGLLAGLLFVLPGAAVMLGLGYVYVTYGQVPLVDAIFLGIKAVVIVIVLEALLKVAKRALKRPGHWVIACLAFLAIFALHLPFPLIIAAAALWGWIATAQEASPPDAPLPQTASVAGTLRTTLLWGALWAAPLAALAVLDADLLFDIGVFFSKLAVVTFGGAYAVLAYMTQQVVVDFGWLSTAQMMDGLGLAETTPGPLILVTQFVGFLTGFGAGGLPLAIFAATITLWVTFVPCFLWIFACAPWIETLRHMPRLRGALDAITAAVVGVILNLSIWFAAHVFFMSIGTFRAGPVSILQPDLSSLDLLSFALATIACMSLLVFRLGLGTTLLIGSILGAATVLF